MSRGFREDLAYLNFPGYYITSEGEIFNNYSGRPVKKSVAMDGQWKVNLKSGMGHYVTVLVARLVAEAFIEPESPRADTIMFLNGDKTDPRAGNLCWRTRSYCHDYYEIFKSEPWPIKAGTQIRCIQDNKIFPSFEAAATYYGLTRMSIADSLHGNVSGCWPLGISFEYYRN